MEMEMAKEEGMDIRREKGKAIETGRKEVVEMKKAGARVTKGEEMT